MTFWKPLRTATEKRTMSGFSTMKARPLAQLIAQRVLSILQAKLAQSVEVAL